MFRDSKGRFIKGSKVNKKIFFDEEEVINLYKSGKTVKEISTPLGYKNGISSEIFKLIKSKGLSRKPCAIKGKKYYFQIGEKNHSWKGGKYKSNGYVFKLINGKYFPEHQYEWCIANNVPVVPYGCVIHHINGIRDDNRPENLAMIPHDYHSKLHWRLDKMQNINRFIGGD